MHRRFELAWRDRRVGSSMETRRRFLDFIVDGESLYDRHRYDLISCLGWFTPAADALAAERLLRSAPPDLGDRTSIYVCPEDGDIQCGAITARIEREGRDILWRDPAHSWIGGKRPLDSRKRPFQDWPELRFNATTYWHVITKRSPDEPRRGPPSD